MNTATISVKLPKNEKERLSRLALRYGMSLPELSRKVLEELVSDTPEESLEEYENPKRLMASYSRALRDWKNGRVRTKL